MGLGPKNIYLLTRWFPSTHRSLSLKGLRKQVNRAFIVSVGNLVRSWVRVMRRVRVKIFLGPYDSLFDSEGVFRRPERWGFGKYGHCQIGYHSLKVDFFHLVF